MPKNRYEEMITNEELEKMIAKLESENDHAFDALSYGMADIADYNKYDPMFRQTIEEARTEDLAFEREWSE